jgi:hypothetical protein
MNTAMQDAHLKVTKVITGNMGAGAATDSANKRADEIFNGGDPVHVKVAKINQLLAGMTNQTAGMRSQIAATAGRIGGGRQAPSPAPKTVHFNDLP